MSDEEQMLRLQFVIPTTMIALSLAEPASTADPSQSSPEIVGLNSEMDTCCERRNFAYINHNKVGHPLVESAKNTWLTL